MDANVDGTIVGYPEVETVKKDGKKGIKALSLYAMEIHKDRTVLRFSISFPEYTYVKMSATMYLLDPVTWKKYKLKAADGMTCGSGLYYTNVKAGEPYRFSFTFEPVPADTRVLDWIAGEWIVEGIRLTPDAPKITRPQTEASTSASNTSPDAAVKFSDVDVKPSFRGGSANQFSTWVNSRLKYPEESKKNRSTGRVSIEFTVNTDGTLQNIRVKHSSGDRLLDEEALRVVRQSPKWTPGVHNGKPVNVVLTFPVIFSLN